MFARMLFLSILSVIVGVSALPTNTTLLEKRAPATVYTKCSKANTVAMTFDDGPYIYNADILNVLKRYNAKATFFFNGNNYGCIYNDANVKRVKAVYAAGHQVGSHTWGHLDLPTLGRPQIVSEFKRVDDALVKIIGARPAFMRPPFGNYNDNVRSVAAERGQAITIWDFDSGDSVGLTAAQSKAKYAAIAKKRPSSILTLNHETYGGTANEVLEYALQQLKAKGYSFVTVAQCVGKSPYVSQVAAGTRDSTWKC